MCAAVLVTVTLNLYSLSNASLDRKSGGNLQGSRRKYSITKAEWSDTFTRALCFFWRESIDRVLYDKAVIR